MQDKIGAFDNLSCVYFAVAQATTLHIQTLKARCSLLSLPSSTNSSDLSMRHVLIKNFAYGRQRISRPMRIVGSIQF